MRPLAILLSCLILTSLCITPNAGANPPADGTTHTVTSTESWTGLQTMEGNVVVADGAVLTVNGDISISEGSNINVEQGGTLVVEGSLMAENLNSGVYLEVYNGTELKPHFPNLYDTGTLVVNFQKDYFTSMFVNVTVGDTTLMWEGEESLSFSDVIFDDTEINVNFSGFWQFPLWVESIQSYDSNGVISTIIAEDLNYTNATLVTEKGDASFTININGTMVSNGGELSGAQINCHASCTFENSSLIWSAPINAFTDSTLSMKTSEINGSRTFEDIIAHDSATILYETSSMVGTGGHTDKWIRLLSSRIISTNLKDAPTSVHFEGLGYNGENGDTLLDENGQIDLGVHNNPQVSKYRRMVEWEDSTGTYFEEDAFVLITLNGGAITWSGDYSALLDPAPRSSTHDVTIPLPYVVIDSVAPEDTQGTANKGLGVMVSVSNSGTANVTSNIQCFEGTDLADVTTLTVSLEPGESKKIPTTWYANQSGAKTLNCKALVPSSFKSLATDLGQTVGTESTEVSFKEPEDSEDLPLILYSIIIMVFVGGAVLFTRMSANQQEDLTSPSAPDEDKDYDMVDIE